MTKDTVVRLRQIIPCMGKTMDAFPDWFQEEWRKDPIDVCKPFNTLLAAAADELEQMRQLNGRLLRRLAGD